jgi:amino acid permease
MSVCPPPSLSDPLDRHVALSRSLSLSVCLSVCVAVYSRPPPHTILHGCVSPADIAERTFGTAGRLVTDLCMIVACFGVLCSYMVIIEDMLSSLLTAWFGVPSDSEQVRIYILCAMMVVLVPLASVRYLNHLRYGRHAAPTMQTYTERHRN